MVSELLKKTYLKLFAKYVIVSAISGPTILKKKWCLADILQKSAVSFVLQNTLAEYGFWCKYTYLNIW